MNARGEVLTGSVHTADAVGNPMVASLAVSDVERADPRWCFSGCTATHAGCGGQCRLPQDGHHWHNCEKCNEGFA